MRSCGKEINRLYDLEISDVDNVVENKPGTAMWQDPENLFGHDEANASFQLNGSTAKQVPSPAKFNHPISLVIPRFRN